MTDKEKELIENLEVDEVIETIGIEKILDNIDDVDISLNKDLDTILDLYSSDRDIADYLEAKGFDFTDYVEDDDEEESFEINQYSDIDLLVELCRRYKKYGVLMKSDIKEITNQIIDEDLIDKCYD